MADIIPPEPVKLFVALLQRQGETTDTAVELLSSRFGPVDFIGKEYPFDATDYYQQEMGAPLARTLLSFEQLIAPDDLPDIKLLCNVLEGEHAPDGKRTINLDAGYIDHHKVVLASAKGAGHKIYLSKGIWADFVARYKAKSFVPMEWSFPDFRDQRYSDELCHIRSLLLQQRRHLKQSGQQ